MMSKKIKGDKSRNLLGAIVLYLLLVFFFGLVATFSWLTYFDQYEIAAIIDKDIKVTATLTEVRSVAGHGTTASAGGWSLKYEFTDKDGTYYSGSYGLYRVSRKDETEAQIGKQIEIFIDGQGRSFPIRERPNSFTYYLVLAIVFTVAAVGIVIFIIIKEILIVKDRKFIEKIRG